MARTPTPLEQLLLRMWQIRCFEIRAGGAVRREADPRLGALRTSAWRRSPSASARRSARTTCITSTHRGHGHCIAKGLDLTLMMAEIIGREDGYCRGHGGSMHITAIDKGMLGADAIVGGLVGDRRRRRARPPAAGARTASPSASSATAPRTRASSTRPFNLAAVLDAPVVFVCENNQWAISTPDRAPSTRVDDIADRAAGYGFPGVVVDGNDVLAVRDGRRRRRSSGRAPAPARP